MSTNSVDSIKPFITETEFSQILDWMLGLSPDQPEVLRRFRTDILNKVSTVLSFNVLAGLRRSAKLDRFISSAEEKLFNSDAIEFMEQEELMTLYGKATRESKDLLESVRKFMAQSKEQIKEENEEVSELAQLIRSYPADKRKELIALLQKGTSVTAEVVS